MKQQPNCPECEKLSAVSKESDKIGDFLGWLHEHGICLVEWLPDDEVDENPWRMSKYDNDFNQLLADYYNIDLKKVEVERTALLKWLQEQNK
jgi:hypothetical protein